MAKKTARQYIEANDFEGAKERFDRAYCNWKEHWFEACYTIAQNCKEWLKRYVLDPIEKTITPLRNKINKNNFGCAFVYLIKMFDTNNDYIYLKCGKTNDLKRRYYELSRTHYKVENIQILKVEEVKTWQLPTEHLAESFEQLVHAYFEKFLENIPKDRWTPIELSNKDFEEIENRYNIINSLA